jgi:hypothetical protein
MLFEERNGMLCSLLRVALFAAAYRAAERQYHNFTFQILDDHRTAQ